MRLSIIILTYNRSDALLAVLHSLASQCQPQDEIIIADDGSSAEHVANLKQGLHDIMPQFTCTVRHVWHPDVGFTAAKARNLGAFYSVGDYLIFLDGDCVPHRYFLARHRELAEMGHFVNGSRVLLSSGLTQKVLNQPYSLPKWHWLRWLWMRLTGQVNKLLWLVGVQRLLALPKLRYQPDFKWRGIRSCNFGLWRKDLFVVNGFDETFEGWGHEDADLVLRLHHAGLKRKNGFWATEVFHLYHPENSRRDESKNHALVIDRIRSGTVESSVGLAQIDISPMPTLVNCSVLHQPNVS